MINAKKAAIKAEKARRKNFRYDFYLIKFGVKDKIKHGKKQYTHYIPESYCSEKDIKVLADYFTKKGYQVQISNIHRKPILRKQIIISW